MMSELVHMKRKPTIAIAYTVWSRKRGAGREIIQKVLSRRTGYRKSNHTFTPYSNGNTLSHT